MRKGYASINWNFLPSAGASLAHPHLQGLVDAHPPYRVRCTLEGGKKLYQRKRIRYWDELERKEKTSDRYLFGDEIRWLANPVPIGEKEVLGILPCSTLEEFRPLIPEFVRGVLTLIHLYRAMGTHAFNMSVFFANEKKDHNFRAFCSMIARINPNPSSLSDSSFMERLHLEPLILTSPEDLGRFFHREKATLAKYPKALFTG
jgi:galactose-1-phosphate uridylyltransferase